MTRGPIGEPITVKPQNNAFTVLAASAVLVLILGLIALYVRANVLLDGGLFGK